MSSINNLNSNFEKKSERNNIPYDEYNLQRYLPDFEYVERDNLVFLKSENNDKFVLVKPKNLFTDSITITDDTKIICFDFLKDYFIKEIIIESESFTLNDFNRLEDHINEKAQDIKFINESNLKKSLSSFDLNHDIKQLLAKIKTVEYVDYVLPKIIYRENNDDFESINDSIEYYNYEREASIEMLKNVYLRYLEDIEYISELIKQKFEKDIPNVEFVNDSLKPREAYIQSLPRIKQLIDEDSNLKYFLIYGIDNKNNNINGTIVKDLSLSQNNKEQSDLLVEENLLSANGIIDIEGKQVGVIIISDGKVHYEEEDEIPF